MLLLLYKVPGLCLPTLVYTFKSFLIVSGPLKRDTDDVRRYAEAARGGVARAASSGSKAPLFYFPTLPACLGYEKCVEVSLLAGG